MFCSNCGNKLADGAKFCSECGARVASPDEQSFRTIADIGLEEPKIAEEVVEPKEEPKREHISFDWSNVVDEPHKKEVVDVRSPWDDTGGIDEKELFAEMTPSSDKSRTMSFIDVLRAEKEEKERAAADRAIEYTEVLEIGQDLGAFDEPPQLHYAPLYEDINEPVRTPFDEPEAEKAEPVFEEPRFEEPVREEPAAEVNAEPAAEPEEPKIEVSRETIAQFDEYVRSFEKEAGIIKDEPRVEKPTGAGVAMPKFELPDFLKRDGEKTEEPEPAAEPATEPAASSEGDELFEEYEIRFDDGAPEEPTFEVPVIDEASEQPVFEEPKYEDYTDGFDFADDDADTGAEDLYLDLDNFRDEPSVEAEPEEEAEPEYEDRPKHGAPEPEYEEDDDEEEEIEEEADEPVNEADLFKEIEETSPKHTGMTIAEPADTQSEIEALKRRLAELMGTPVEEEPEKAAEEEVHEEAPEEEPAEPAELFLEPEDTSDVDEIFAGLTAVSEAAEEPAAEEAPVIEEVPEALAVEEPSEEPEEETIDLDLYLEPEDTSDVDEIFAGLTAVSEAAEEPAAEETPVIEEVIEEPAAEPVVLEEVPAPVVEEAVEEAPVVEEVIEEPAAEPVVLEEVPAPVVEEVIEEPAAEPVVLEEVPAPVVEEVIEEPAAEPVVLEEVPAPVVGEAVEEAPVIEEVIEEPAASDALSLEELEKDLFGEIPEGEVEETKKIDKFYTLYKKNEEFQRLLDEEYEKLKNGGAEPVAPAEAEKPAELPAEETPAEDKKAYRQVEDETIYMSKEDVEKQIGLETKPEEKPAGSLFEVKTDALAPVELGAAAAAPKADAKPDKKAEKAAKKAEKAAKKAAKDSYADVDSGSGILTVLAVIIAIILVILLAVIVIMTVAPNSGIGIWINGHIQNITSGIGAVLPNDGQFLL